MTNSCLAYAIHQNVALLTINRPDRRNAWTPELEVCFRAAIEQADADPNVRCIVITGAGSAFSVGMDMKVLSDSSKGEISADQALILRQPKRYHYLHQVSKPLVAAINGAAAGVGLCIALYCDLRYIASSAKVAAPYSRRGLVAEHGIGWLLLRLIGPMYAADMLMTGRPVGALEADKIGLAMQLSEENFLATVICKATEIASLSSPRAVKVIKRQLHRANSQTLDEATVYADEELAKARQSSDYQEGVRHFVEKRPPNFTGE